ncbi:hypothetical protein RLIN73S_03971 [Rhodanobacter lindaniclasticus]
MRVGDRVAHLHVVLHRHRRNGIGIGLALALELGEHRSGVVRRGGQQVGQHHGVLEAAVHALAVERHDRVRGIADQQGAAVQVPTIEVERGQRADRVAVVVRAEVRQQRQQPRELRTEECRRRGGIGQGGETGCGALRGQEQGDGKAALGVRQRDAHVAAARPDVQRVRLQRVLVAAAAELLQGGGQLAGGRDLQFLVAVSERLDPLTQRRMRVHGAAQGGTGAVRTDQQAGLDVLLATAGRGETNAHAVEIDAGQRLAEMQPRTGRLGGIEQQHVQRAARDRPDHLAVVHAVALQGAVALAVMHHPPAHHHRVLQHGFGQPRHAQRLQAAFGQRKVDRATTQKAGAARIGALFVNVDREAALRQLHGQQRADQAAANEGDGLPGHARSADEGRPLFRNCPSTANLLHAAGCDQPGQSRAAVVGR